MGAINTTLPSQRLTTPAGRKGWDTARRIRDAVITLNRRGQRVDLVKCSRQTMHNLTTAWLEMGFTANTVPTQIDNVPLVMDFEQSEPYMFLRDYHPYEKRRAKAEGVDLYSDSPKKIIAVEH